MTLRHCLSFQARKWDTLTYQTYFTPRAANVAFGWWSHDIGGFSADPVDESFHTEGPELLLRWLQFGQYAPILRQHCRYCEQRIWTWGDGWYALMRRPLVARSNLVPYIYTHAALRSYGTGEALLTPTYWDPKAATEEQAYAPEFGRQYFFGREMLVAPVTEPLLHDPNAKANNDTTYDAGNKGSVPRSVWLPPGEWVSWATPTDGVLKGPIVQMAQYGLGDIPVYVRAGAVIPTRTMASAYHPAADPLVWMVAPSGGEVAGQGTCYEDDGESLSFRGGVSSTTTLSYTTTLAGGRQMSLMASASNGTFTGMAAARAQWVVLYGEAAPPASASCDGKPLAKTAAGVAPGWWIAVKSDEKAGDDNELMVEAPSLVLACGSRPTDAPREIKATWV